MPKVSAKPLKEPPTNRRKSAETVHQPSLDPDNSELSRPEQVDEEELPPPIPSLEGVVATPGPPHFKYHTDNARGWRPNDFFSYWCSLTPEFKGRQTAYVYRNWPVISVSVPDKKHGGYKSSCQIAKLPGEKSIRDEDDMLHQFGSGDYTIRLNDCVLRKTIALCVIKGLRNDEHPPCQPLDLLDVLVYDDPANQSFINNLRLRGILQDHEREQEKEQEDMSQNETVDRLTGLVEKQFERDQQRDQQQQQNKQPPADSTELAAKTVALASDALLKGINLGRTAVDNEVATAVAKAKAENGDGSPTKSLEMATQLIALAKSLIPPTPTATPTTAGTVDSGIAAYLEKSADRESKLQSQIVAMMQSQITALQTRLDAPVVAPAVTTAAPKDDFVASLDKLIAVKDKLQGIFGGPSDEVEREEKVPIWLQVLQSGLASLPTAVTGLLAMSYNMAIAKTGQGTPLPPGAPPPAADPNGGGMGATALNPTTEGDSNVQRSIYLAMLKQIERPFLTHLNDPTLTGADFADAMMKFHGRIAYDATRELGKEVLMGLLMSYKPIAEVIAQIPERANQFVDDFLDADNILAEDQQDDLGGGELPPIVAAQESAPKRRKEAKV